MEERHLHDGVDTRTQLAFTGDFRRIHHEETRFFLVQHRLNFLRQSVPHFIRAIRRVEQENAAGFQAFGHLIFVDKLQLVAADKISFINQVGGINRLFTDAQMRNRQTARFFRVIDEITLGVKRRRVTDNLDVVFGR
ncbi:hypothetical protein D3C75_822350 [compost metagenome]